MPSARPTLCLVLAVVLALSGCSGLFGTGETDVARETATAVPVPTTTPEAEAGASASASASNGTPIEIQNTTGVEQPRYLSLSPTCERPPGLVIHIQVEALRNNNPATDEGIATVWRFAAPSNKAVTGPYEAFVGTVRTRYRPLLTADSVRYDPITREGDRVRRNVTVTTDNSTTTYEWILTRQSDPPYEDCWMTSGVTQVPSYGSPVL